jgi:hypothetical protein
MSLRSPNSPDSNSNRNHSLNHPHAHAPNTPSGLREAHTLSASPEETRYGMNVDGSTAPSSSNPSPLTSPAHPNNDPAEDEDIARFDGLEHRADGENTALLRKHFDFGGHPIHEGPCDHGTFSPRLESRTGSVRSSNDYGFGGAPSNRPENGGGSSSMLGSLLEGIGMKNGPGPVGKKKMSTTRYLAERHGVKNTTTMYALNILPEDVRFVNLLLMFAALQVLYILHSIFRVDPTI